ncbi:MAG: UdgX family uracil-DNA binding protein [Lysobacter sp.]|nr:UdgX family uracil-DNA binding protein [Lysobacter sp.]
MIRAIVDPPWDFSAWRAQARMALRGGIEPASIDWQDPQHLSLLDGLALNAIPARIDAPRVPRAFLPLAARVLAHREPQRHALLYRLLWRMTHSEPHLLTHVTDRDVHRARELEKAVRRDAHKMKAFVRFRAVPGEDNAYVAWFEPVNNIVDLVAPFFMRRFAGMRWAILTPDRSVSWDLQTLSFGHGALQSDAPGDDAQESLWRTYYANIFNPARTNPRMMRQEMPQKYWKNLPEAQLLPDLLRNAGHRVRDMAERVPQPPRRRIPLPPLPAPDPADDSLAALKAAARECRRCLLWEPATQTVFGEGPQDARVMIVGEQPGDEEDLSGRPFVGPAGKLFNGALAELGIDRAQIYITNAVKHFKFERRGKFRLHRNPEPSERAACRIWLERELATVRPHIVVCMGATASEAVFGKGFRLLQERGVWRTLVDGTRAFATVHPAWVLRQRDATQRDAAYRNLVDDLRLLVSGTAED